MGLFASVSSKQVDEFAKELASGIAKRYPPALQNRPDRALSVARVSKILEDSFSRAAEFQRTHKLGVYKKARLGNAFRWEMKELGYGERFIELATEGLIVFISRKPTAQKNAAKD